MDIQNNGFLSIEQLTDRYLKGQKQTQSPPETGPSFQEVLQSKSLSRKEQGLKFSRHAADRLLDRGISLSDEQLGRLEDGTNKAQQKGIRDSLVLVDELAFIVNIPNRTVVTAMDSTQTNDNIFTNINGAVIM
ncbi:MAG: flagellar protein [Roseburia sp.]|nr:flagellar protein [Roseburia sp.]